MVVIGRTPAIAAVTTKAAPDACFASVGGRVTNPPQVGNLPHTQRLAANSTITLDGETVVSIDWRQR